MIPLMRLSQRTDISQLCSLYQGGAGTLFQLATPTSSTLGTPVAGFPPSLFWSGSFPKFFFAMLDLLIRVPCIKITRDNSFKNHLVKECFRCRTFQSL